MTIARLALLTTLFTPAVFAAPLTVDTYNPQEKGIFAVSSTPGVWPERGGTV